MEADRATLRATLWHSASALQLLPREQPLLTSCALMRNATGSLIHQYNMVAVLGNDGNEFKIITQVFLYKSALSEMPKFPIRVPPVFRQ